MKSRLWIIGVAVCLVLAGAAPGFAASYYINDVYVPGADIYTTGGGNDSNSGTNGASPKLTLGNVIATCNLQPGDVVYIDTGTYTPSTISNTVVGTAGSRIVFQGSTNFAAGGTEFTGSGNILTVRGKYLTLRDLRTVGGVNGLYTPGASYCEFERFVAVSNSSSSAWVYQANSNVFRRCVFNSVNDIAFVVSGGGSGNYIEHSVLHSDNGLAMYAASGSLTNVIGCVLRGKWCLPPSTYTPGGGSRNIFFPSVAVHMELETVSGLQSYHTNWYGNTYADPKFVDADGLDFHLLSATGYATNGGGGVTNLAVENSPAIDFGPANNTAWTNEPGPNGSRVNIGLYGGTTNDASKSRTNDWLFAMSFNDGGTLIQTGRIDWVGGNLGAGATVDLQFSTNNGATWSNIITGVAVTNETYTWASAFSHPAVLWRVVSSTNLAVASTNAKPFSVRATTNSVFSFYVNDGSTNNDVYCSAVGSSTNSGVDPADPKQSLQGILNAYQLRGGDTVYVDTGTYLTNFTTTITSYDSGSADAPMRIIGSLNGSLLSRGSTSADTLQFSPPPTYGTGTVTHLQIENLQLTGGRDGLNANRASDVVLKNVHFTTNQWGVVLTASTGFRFEGCLAAGNALGAISAVSTTTTSNQWLNGVMWGNPTILSAWSNGVSVSNSILGSGTTLFDSQVVPGDHNVVWDTAVGLTYNTFTELQESGLGWSRSLYADPLFADEGQSDYHPKSEMGRYNPVSGTYETNDLVHSPAIDLGDPTSPAWDGTEPPPNGDRLNTGLYGGTAQASKSRTNEWLQVLSYMDGGTLDAQAGSWLRWDSGNLSTGSLVTIWLSRDGGVGWEELATNVTAADGEYFYQNTSTNDSSSYLARWMVTLESNTNVYSPTPTNFTYRNGVFEFFVNDSSTNNDVYCSVVGNNTNLGVSAGTPKATLSNLLAESSFSPGDRIFVDTGVYTNPAPINLGSTHSGASTNPVVIVGSTNRLAGGSVFGPGINLSFIFQSGASNIILRDIAMTNVTRGVAMTNAVNIVLDGVEVRNASSRAFDLQANTREIEMVGCVAQGGGIGLYLNQVTNITVHHSVLWQNNVNAVYVGSQVGAALENSVLGSTNTGVTLLSYSSLTGFSSDYNGIYTGPNNRVALNRSTSAKADNLAAWQSMSGGEDVHSVPGDPVLADPATYDYHLKTEQTLGRIEDVGTRTSDSVSSPLLDAGDPADDASLEPEPNGSRVNIGRWGGTDQASIALTTPWLRTVSYGDRGSVTNGTVSLLWTSGGVTAETVKVEVSVDGGQTWDTTVASNVPVTNGIASWAVAGLPDTPAGAWRVVREGDTNLWAQSTNFFSIRNNPLNLFVARADTNENIYATAPGATNNWMATSNAPLLSLRTVFDHFDLEAGDQIWVDSGTYADTTEISVSLKNSGTTSNPVRVTGNTNRPYSGTVLARVSRTVGAKVLDIRQAGGLSLEALVVSNGWTGIYVENTEKLTIERLRATHSGSNAVNVGASTSVDLNRVLVDNSLFFGVETWAGSSVQMTHSLLRNNGQANLRLRGGSLDLRNSIIEATGSSQYAVYLSGSGAISSDFNNIRATDGANVVGGDDRLPDRFLIDWQISSGFSNDVNSMGYDAEFHDADGSDFHLASEYGRFDPIAGEFVTNDASTSHLIDLGDPASSYANEPPENGDRANIGLYGGSTEASKSSGLGSLVPLTMSDGGTVRGDVLLFWAWNGLAGNEFVYVDFSWDGGDSWTNIASNVFADVGSTGQPWSTTNFPSTAMGVWRVCTTNGADCGQTTNLFAVKNDPLSYYINDGSTNGDIYCAVAGDSGNTGLSSNSPLNSLTTLLNRYKVEHGDTVYIDTGIYPASSTLSLVIPSAAPTNWLVFQGSTNEAAGGSVFTNSGNTAVMELRESKRIEFRNLQLHGGQGGLRLSESSSNRVFQVRSVGSLGNGFELETESDQNEFIQCAALHFFHTGFYVVKTSSEIEAPVTNTWSGGVLVPVAADSNGYAVATGALFDVTSGRLYVSNSVLVSSSPGHDFYSTISDTIFGDYNLYHREYGNSLFARVDMDSPVFGVGVRLLDDLKDWSEWNASDSNSLAGDPLFADLTTGDIHPRSQGGRYDPAVNDFTNDLVTSPLIDAADPALPWAQETPLNGSRANLGVYGGTSLASRSPTNGYFVLTTLNDGGTVEGAHTLTWLAFGAATNTGYTVAVDLSTNSGANWQTIGTAIPVTQEELVWNSATNASVPTARWRVRSLQIPGVSAESAQDFLIHNSNITYYVNDADPTNDMYCSSPGSSTNTGLSAGSPLDSLASLLARYNLEPGDQVLMDTGEYTYDTPLSIGPLDSGMAADPVTIQGSTNYPGTRIRSSGINLDNARGVQLRNLQFTDQVRSQPVLAIESCEDIELHQLDVLGGQYGVEISTSSNVLMRNFSIFGVLTNGLASVASYNTRLEFGAIWSNGVAQILTQNQLATGYSAAREASFVTVSNCVMGAFGIRQPIYEIRGNLSANYNNLYLVNGALAALSYLTGFPQEFDSVGKWSGDTGQDALSLSHLPGFADVPSGDFHLKSSAGRYHPPTGTNVYDNASENSPLIDAGDPGMAVTEPPENGGRVNIGRHGNTDEASLTPTNGTLTLISFNDGGRAAGTNVVLNWLARGAATNATVTIQYSADGGGMWTNLVTGISATDGAWTWDSTLSEQTVQGLLRLEGSDGSSVESDRFFSVRNAPFYFYINDEFTANDVYCFFPGNNGNSGLATNEPMADLNALLTKYDLEGGDVVYIDTGIYGGVYPWRIAQADSAGSLELPPVVFQGSTNSFPSGTVLNRAQNVTGIEVDYAVGIQLRNITVSNTVGPAVLLNNCYEVDAEWMSVGVGNQGFNLNGGSLLRVANSLVYDSFSGIVVQGWNQDTNTVFPVIENNVFWGLNGTALTLSSREKATVRNNILSVLPGFYVYELGQDAVLTADYNSIWLEDGARVSKQSRDLAPIIYETVGAWSSVSGQDQHTYDGAPLLVDADARNFRLQSQNGRWVPGFGWTNDAASSPLIDAGWPGATEWTNEPPPNGGRINIGPYGGSGTASRTPTNSALHLLTLNRGGVASGLVELNWRATGMATSHAVRVWVSTDNGSSWELITEGIPASLGGITWNSGDLSSPVALWWVEDQDEAGVEAISELPFVLHNDPIHYYVNDDYPDGDVYCTGGAVGSSTNTGILPDSPKRWVSEILDTYNLEPGDVVYMDTGTYQASEETRIGDLDSGDLSQDPDQQVTIRGSTNAMAGGSLVIIADPSVNGIELDGAFGVRLQHLNIWGATNGIALDDSFYIATDWLKVRDCHNGLNAHVSSNIVISHSALLANHNAGVFMDSFQITGLLRVESSVIWSNHLNVFNQGGAVTVTNSIIGVMAPDSFGYFLQADIPLTEYLCNYNNLFVGHPSGSAGGYRYGSGATARTSVFASVSAWAAATGQDANSLPHDPLLADPDNDDFHLRSVGGRFEPGGGIAYDTESSHLIDAGPPGADGWLLEPDPNGRRINMGLYGGTDEASMTPLSGWITLISLNDGGNVSGAIPLTWAVGGAATNYTLNIEYSPDNGGTWTNIVNGWPADTELYMWDSVPYGRSALGRWRAWCLEDPSILQVSLAPFVLRNGGTISYYVNDGSTNGDVYCSAIGDDANDGLTTSTPKAGLQAILDTYELAPEDVVYVDSGTYEAGVPPITIDQTDSGWSNLFVTIQGSTNPAVPTVFQAPSFSVPHVFVLAYAVNVRLRDMTFQNARQGLKLDLAQGCELDRVRIENNSMGGLYVSLSSDIRLIRSILWNNAGMDGGTAIELRDSTLAIENSVLWGHPTAVSIITSDLTVTNSALDASGVDGRIFVFSFTSSASNSYSGDYNCFSAKNGSLLAEQQQMVGGSDFYNNLPTWGGVNGSDLHSMTLEPEFANEIQGDFHPKSTQGRWTPSGWTVDSVRSPLIDSGAPAWPSNLEEPPNGGIINIGAYGNTAQASMTQTNPPWLQVASYNDCDDGMSGQVLLYWLHGGMDSNEPVRVQYSTDYQINWTDIATNIPAGTRQVEWDVSTLPLTLALNWRVVSQNNTNYWDASDCPVSVKVGNYDFYVNDSDTNGDVWCTGPGLEWNPLESYGTNAATPLNSLQALLDNYPVSGGDQIFIDTGEYSVTSTNRIILDGRNTGTELKPLKIYGSTNVVAGGALWIGNGTADGIRVQNTRHIELNDLRIRDAVNGLYIQNVDTILLSGMELFQNTSNGVYVSASSDVDMRNSLCWRNKWYGLQSTGSRGNQQVIHGTFWGNAWGAVQNNTGLLIVSNSILVVTNDVPLLYENGGAEIDGDYNTFGLGGGDFIGYNSQELAEYRKLSQWQAAGRDLYTLLLDPLFVDPENGNFHLQSRAGYWSNGAWEVSTDTSWAIDAGDPSSTAYTNELPDNGSRINQGAYGATDQASLTDSSVPELLVVSLMDGGMSTGSQPLYWLYRGLSDTNRLTIEYSPNNGVDWVLVESGVSIDSTPYAWTTFVDPTPEALWRVLLEPTNSNIQSSTQIPFTLRTRALTYYVNDDSQDHDVYTGAIGSPANNGYQSNSPLHSIQSVLDEYQLIGGDEIKVDTGVYTLSNSVLITLLNSGDETNNRVNITGSTNWTWGGSQFSPMSGMLDPGFLLHGAQYVRLSNFRLHGFTNGVSFAQSTYHCAASDLDITGSVGPGIQLSQTDEIHLERVLVREGMTNAINLGSSRLFMNGCVLWSNQYSAIYLANGGQLQMTNTVVEVSGLENYCYYSPTSVTVRTDYNNLFIHDAAQIAEIDGLQYQRLPQWARATAQDRFSLSTDPLFHDSANGDFHLRSVAGRYEYGVGWTNDAPSTNLADFSPMIDMGSPKTAWSNELIPNGNKRNIGLYGNTTQASKSNTNPWFQVITAMSGGLMYGGINLTWGFGGGIDTNALVRLEYSFDNGESSWARIGESAAGVQPYYWQSDIILPGGSEQWQTSPAGRWRIYLVGDTNIMDETDTYFGLRNSPFKYYVNDGATNNDLYAEAVGDDDNLGFYPAAPKLTLQRLLEDVDLEATDQVYVDTGIYYLSDTSNPVLWGTASSGEPNEPVLLIGSTHADGSWYVASNNPVGDPIFSMEAEYVSMRDLKFMGDTLDFDGTGLVASNLVVTNGGLSMLCNDSTFSDLSVDRSDVFLSGADNLIRRMTQRWGRTAVLGTNVALVQSVVYTTNNLHTGVFVNAVGAVVSNCTVVASRGTAVSKSGYGSLRLEHNILVSGGSSANSVIDWKDGALNSDWNNLWARDSAWVGSYSGRWEKLAYWQAASGKDASSVSFDPLFQNETAGDFHLNSTTGRWSIIFNDWDVDSEQSPVIDLGNPWVPTAEEPMYNGYRRNLGAFGGTLQASKSLTNLWLTVLSLNDGGVARGTQVVLRWAAGNAGGTTVTLQYYNGTDWVDIATGIDATDESYVWDSTGFTDSFDARWRVVAEGGSGVSDQTDTTFALRNNPHEFYVNDTGPTNDDIYCSDIGYATNNGLTPATPTLTLQGILDTYDLEGGDTVYIDSGTYSSTQDIQIIWSRSGDTNADVVIQGNTNGAHTILTRSGSTNFPAIGIDVKSSHIQLNHFAIRGIDRGIYLESNRYATVHGVLLNEVETGITALGARGTAIRNSAFWKTGRGIRLSNTSTSILENLTFALSSLAGIQLTGTESDTLRNNIFIPEAGAYAYDIGSSTSLLANAEMDYNLYDFSQTNSGFYAGATTNLRFWQLGFDRDYRSAVTNADLEEIDFTGDFHPKSEYGRWTTGGWVLDGTTSWAVDHGNYDQDFGNEPDDNGGRINIGMYGNTVQASKGNTNIAFDVRTMNETNQTITSGDSTWPLIWSAHLVDGAETVQVQFSGDGGTNWITLTNVSAYTEYFVWTTRPEHQTAHGRWRVIGVTDTNLVDINDHEFTVDWFDLKIIRIYPVAGLMRFDWEGGLQGYEYRIEYSDDFGQTWQTWQAKYNGPAPINMSQFEIPPGGSQVFYTFEDRTSYLRRTRLFRIVEIQD